MGLQVKNDYLLLEPIEENTSQFNVRRDNQNFKYKLAEFVQMAEMSIDHKSIIYLFPDQYETLKVEGKEYTVAKFDDIVGVEDAA